MVLFVSMLNLTGKLKEILIMSKLYQRDAGVGNGSPVDVNGFNLFSWDGFVFFPAFEWIFSGGYKTGSDGFESYTVFS